MATIISESELLRRAVAFIIEEKTYNSKKSMHELIDEASMRFNLSPVEAESLSRLLEQTTTQD